MIRILIIEDDPDMLGLLAKLLRDEFPEPHGVVHTADNVESARQRIDEALNPTNLLTYDLVIIDFRLPQKRSSDGTLENPELDLTLGEYVGDLMPEATIMHLSSFLDDPKV